ncbi:malonyl-CoA decarboxylase, mitochondrial [Iris pallida]|uniref:Malonyl-CoA decarboxylase, mitochondrial n=1 Tax=Iris pallida TaxID=29817 RepID=A0AAX6GS39_IRIPA|nr:malonyl-CoA decarboxylase, mitochondrial [Iris pallida]
MMAKGGGINRNALSVLMRSRVRASAIAKETSMNPVDSVENAMADVMRWMRASIAVPTDRTESVDSNLRNFSQNYVGLSQAHRRELLLALAKDHDVNRERVRELMQQYLSLDVPQGSGGEGEEAGSGGVEHEGAMAAVYRTERSLRDALKPKYAVLFERLNEHPGGLKVLEMLRADLLSLLVKDNMPSLRALESYLKEKLVSWLSPAALELHQITWDDSASLLEKIDYEGASNQKPPRFEGRLSVGRRCFGFYIQQYLASPLYSLKWHF